MKRALGLALVAAGALPALAQDDGLRVRLKAWLAAKDDAAKKTALDALAALPVPARDARVRALREALAPPARPAGGRVLETLTVQGAPLECFLATPKPFNKTPPVVLSLCGRGGTGHEGLHGFSLPDEEWKDLKKRFEEDLKKRGYDPAKVTIRKPVPTVACEDVLVVSPSWVDAASERQSLARAEAVVLESLARANRAHGADQDRVVLTGLSLGGAVAIQVASRNPDRFAGVFSIAGSHPPTDWENLRPLQVYVLHGDKDDDVPIAEGRRIGESLKEAKVEHVFREAKGMKHAWPPADEGAKVRAWMRARAREPWPRAIAHRFDARTSPRRVFWVEVPAGPRDVKVEAKVEDNTVELVVTGAKSVVLHLGDPLVDTSKPVRVKVGDKVVLEKTLEPSWATLLEDLEATGWDAPRAAPARVEVALE